MSIKIRIRILPQVYTCWKSEEKFLTFVHSSWQSTFFIFHLSVIGVFLTFNILVFGQYWYIENYILSFCGFTFGWKDRYGSGGAGPVYRSHRDRQTVLRIHEILDPDPTIYVRDLQDINKFFAYYFLLHFHHFSRIKSHKEVTKQQESMFFLLFLLHDRRIRIPIRISE